MSRKQYYVLSDGSRWKIKYEGNEYHYATQAAAIKAAVDAAHKAGSKGQDAQVLIQGRDGQWRAEWTYGNDPYPPRG